MTTVPAPGWYPDPQAPTLMRWWDGTRWTDDTFERVEPLGGPMVPAGERGQQAAQEARPSALTTPDGVRLATWGRRVGARVIDGVVVGVVTVLLSLPLLTGFLRRVMDMGTQQSASGTFDPFAVYDGATVRELLTITVVGLAVNAAYEMGFLLWRQATPGKLLLGLRVRRLAGPSLTGRAVALRWATFVLPGQVPTVGPLWTVVDCTWPLWDGKRQALHDKAAGTCVVHPLPAHDRAVT